MFSGIILEVGVVVNFEKDTNQNVYIFTVSAVSITNNLLLGSSIAVNGVCLTVVNIDEKNVTFNLLNETIAKTNFSEISLGSYVNLERSLCIGDEIGGHMLSGHIMGTAVLIEKNNEEYTFFLDRKILKYIFLKGFVAIDGVSLTVVNVDKTRNCFSVHLIPETLKRTNFSKKEINEKVNIEVDYITQVAVDTVEKVLLSCNSN